MRLNVTYYTCRLTSPIDSLDCATDRGPALMLAPRYNYSSF